MEGWRERGSGTSVSLKRLTIMECQSGKEEKKKICDMIIEVKSYTFENPGNKIQNEQRLKQMQRNRHRVNTGL